MKRLLAGLFVVVWAAASAQTVRVGLSADPDSLDPVLSSTYVSRIVFASLCDKLFDVGPDLTIVPQLATSYAFSEDNRSLTLQLRQGVTFHDGTPFDAEAVRYNLERALNFPGSNRASEISQLSGVEVVDAATVRLTFAQPFAPILAQLADRAGMMVSPTAAEAAGEAFGNEPVCAGPFRFSERVAQDRIVLERFPEYWDAERVSIQELVFLPIPDSSVRLANLQAGDLDLIEGPAATDLEALRNDPNLVLPSAPSLGYQGLTINIANPEPLGTPLGSDPRVREALELALDRNVINQAVFNDEYLVGNQAVPTESPWYNADYPVAGRDLARAQALLQEAGVGRVAFELTVSNDPVNVRVGEVVQALGAEAGFDITLRAAEFTTALDLTEAGDYEAFLVGWSGRLDPDGNIHSFQTCEGSNNDTGYCDPETDRLLNEARAAGSDAERKTLYDEAGARYLPDRHIIYLYHTVLFFPHTAALGGFQASPDGLLRFQDVSMGEASY